MKVIDKLRNSVALPPEKNVWSPLGRRRINVSADVWNSILS